MKSKRPHKIPDVINGRNPIAEPREGDRWNEGSGINGLTHIVRLVGSVRVSYLLDGQRERVVTKATFRRYARWYWSFGGNDSDRPAEEIAD